MARPAAVKKGLKPKTLDGAHKTMGSWDKVARHLGMTNRMLSYYRASGVAPIRIVDAIERIAAGEA